MAEAIIGPLVGRLHDLAVAEARALIAVNDDIQKLRDKLMWLQAFLLETDARRRAVVSDEITKVLLLQTRDAVFDAEDALDHFYLYKDMSRFPKWARPSLKFISTFTIQARMRHTLSNKIKAINSRLEQIIQNKDRYKMDDTDKRKYMAWKASTTSSDSHRDWDDLQLRILHMHDAKREQLLNAMVEEDDKEVVEISVYGKSGVGKTTLVRRVYNEIEKWNHFEKVAMESVGPNLTAINVLHQIVQQLTDDNENCPIGEVRERLGKKLKGKKYLLVIDGEVSSTERKHILSILRENAGGVKGSRVVHVSQHKPYDPHHVCIELENLDEDVAIELFHKSLPRNVSEAKIQSKENLIEEVQVEQDMKTHHEEIDKGIRVVHLAQTQLEPQEQPPSYHVCIELKNIHEDATIEISHKKLQSENDTRAKTRSKGKRWSDRKEAQDRDLEKYRSEIYRITEGLPLAVVLLAGLLQTKESHEWTEVFNYLWSSKMKRIDSIMTLCFSDLPHELKSCFKYFAALPPNVTVEANSLVCMWMAEGFLTSPMVGMTLEKVGQIYLDELIARNLVNPVYLDDDSMAGTKFVAIQNIVHTFLQKEAHEQSFLEVHKGDDIPTLTSARRLSLQNYTDKYAALAHQLPKLRSIFSQFEQQPKEILQGPDKKQDKPEKKLRKTSNKKVDIRSHIRQLLQGSEFLRVINLQGIEIGEELPHEIRNVARLQYLGITSCSLKRIPASIGSLDNLQTLDVRETGVRKLPNAFWMIKTLRHVFGFALKLPKHMIRLKHLQTLNSIELDHYEEGLEGKIGQMIHLDNLFVWNISDGNMESLSSSLGTLEYLTTLAFDGRSIPSSMFTTISLRRVKYMTLRGQLKPPRTFEDMESCLPNLQMLSLTGTQVSQQFITELAELQSLATLFLYSDSYTGDKLVFMSNGFRCLKKIKLDVKNLKTLEVQNGALPQLQELDILSTQSHYRPKIIGEEKERIGKVIV